MDAKPVKKQVRTRKATSGQGNLQAHYRAFTMSQCNSHRFKKKTSPVRGFGAKRR